MTTKPTADVFGVPFGDDYSHRYTPGATKLYGGISLERGGYTDVIT